MARGTARYVRFAQALAFVGGSAGIAGCYGDHRDVETADAGTGSDAPLVADAPPPDVPNRCATCVCTWGIDAGPVVSCDGLGYWECCAAVGPCAPPDLPA